MFLKFYRMLTLHKVPVNLNYAWNAGSMAGICLLSQIVTGLLLTIYYVPSVDLAFYSVDAIMREVENGWWVRYMHANGASFFFFVVYLHLLRGIYYGSYMPPRERVWMSGLTMLFLMMGIAFMGYILPWGQMSFWAATVITSLVNVIPFYGTELLIYLIGGEYIGFNTLLRFFTLHYMLPFVLFGLMLLHVLLLHEVGSNNPVGVESKIDSISFHWAYTVKDLLGLWFIFFFGSILVYFYPNVLLHPDNYIPANYMCTPAHIVPEWYFLFFYGVLRLVPDKEGGVILTVIVIFLFYMLPLLTVLNYQNFYVYSGELKFSFFTLTFFLFIIGLFIVSYCGGQVASQKSIQIGWRFLLIVILFLICIPVIEDSFFINYLQSFIYKVKFNVLDKTTSLEQINNYRLFL